ncbi:hypothetical protein ACFPM0_33885 [Pseudonocardia sulfidoxydans]|uniref:hypothetical protein n=1 Tax=Pseudonocardia sulfidoxydans TaxID=54011 RepID=UPI0036098E2C
MSWDLSPSSATKMTPKLTAVATRTSYMDHPSISCRIEERNSSTRQLYRIEGLARLVAQAVRPDHDKVISMSTATLRATPLRRQHDTARPRSGSRLVAFDTVTRCRRPSSG